MFIITGGAGFIGSVLAWKLNQEGITDIMIVDNLASSTKWKNLPGRRYEDYIHRDAFLDMVNHNKLPSDIQAIFHMGACSSTTEADADYLMRNNYQYSKTVAEYAIRKRIRFIYASSAATYGDGTRGFQDDESALDQLLPMNMYGYSKHLFDVYANRKEWFSEIAGLKFFNVFGPNEYHKGDMASVVYKSWLQILETGRVKLFKSNHPDYRDGEQLRDFIYVKDVVDAMWWLYQNPRVNGLYNLGTGIPRTWKDLVTGVFHAMNQPVKIEYIDMPPSLKKSYQNFTVAPMQKLASTGCPVSFQPLESSVQDYVANYLMTPYPNL